MNRTRVRRATRNRAALQRATVARARDVELAREVSRVRPAPPTEHTERGTDVLVQRASLVGRHVDGHAHRIDPRSPQHLVDQQIAEAGDPVLVHQHGLDWRGALRERVIELARGERERFGLDAGNDINVLGGVAINFLDRLCFLETRITSDGF